MITFVIALQCNYVFIQIQYEVYNNVKITLLTLLICHQILHLKKVLCVRTIHICSPVAVFHVDELEMMKKQDKCHILIITKTYSKK